MENTKHNGHYLLEICSITLDSEICFLQWLLVVSSAVILWSVVSVSVDLRRPVLMWAQRHTTKPFQEIGMLRTTLKIRYVWHQNFYNLFGTFHTGSLSVTPFSILSLWLRITQWIKAYAKAEQWFISYNRVCPHSLPHDRMGDEEGTGFL